MKEKNKTNNNLKTSKTIVAIVILTIILAGLIIIYFYIKPRKCNCYVNNYQNLIEETNITNKK